MRKPAFCIFLWPYYCILISFSLLTITVRGVSSKHCLMPFFHLSMNISETNGQITTKFYLKHYWSGGKATLPYGLDRSRTLVSMAPDSLHRVIIGKICHCVFLAVFDQILFVLAGN